METSAAEQFLWQFWKNASFSHIFFLAHSFWPTTNMCRLVITHYLVLHSFSTLKNGSWGYVLASTLFPSWLLLGASSVRAEQLGRSAAKRLFPAPWWMESFPMLEMRETHPLMSQETGLSSASGDAEWRRATRKEKKCFVWGEGSPEELCSDFTLQPPRSDTFQEIGLISDSSRKFCLFLDFWFWDLESCMCPWLCLLLARLW